MDQKKFQSKNIRFFQANTDKYTLEKEKKKKKNKQTNKQTNFYVIKNCQIQLDKVQMLNVSLVFRHIFHNDLYLLLVYVEL